MVELLRRSIFNVKKKSRNERIRTSGLFVPNEALYQAELHSEKFDSGVLLRQRG
jgi:hypothetical protein